MSRHIAIVLAILTASCGKLPTTPPTTSPATTRSARLATVIAEPKTDGHLFGTLYSVRDLAALSQMSNVTIQPGMNSDQAPVPDIASLPGILAKAVPLEPVDPRIDQWSYAPWYTASFDADGRRWTVEGFLGGLGMIIDDAGRKAMFRVK